MDSNAKHTPRKVFLDPDYRNTFKYRGEVLCCRCQKPIKSKDYRLAHLVDGGMQVVHPEDSHMIPTGDAGNMDWHPIGNDCARRIGLEYTYLPYDESARAGDAA